MAKPLTFLFGDHEIPLAMQKVDRSKLYGFKEVEAVDENGDVCELATLGDDGRTLIGRGGTGLGWIDVDGAWCDKNLLKPINVDGDEIEPVKSSFASSIKLFDTATAEDYLEHDIRLVYAMQLALPENTAAPVAELDDLRRELRRGTIFTFPYSYRGGLESDTAFLLLSASGEIMMAVGNRTTVSYVSIQSQVVVDEESQSADDDSDVLDFDMI